MERQPETIRSEFEINALINAQVLDTVDVLGEILTGREKSLLVAVTHEKHTTPMGRVIYLHQLAQVPDVTENMRDVVNNIIISIKQNLSSSELAFFQQGVMSKLLDDVK